MKNTIFCHNFSLQVLDECLKILKHCSCDVHRPGIYTFCISKNLKIDFHRTMLICNLVSVDFVSISFGCRICAWSLKFYTNQAYKLHVRGQKGGFRSGEKGSVWLQHSWSCKSYFSCRFCECKNKKNHLTQGQRLKCLNQMMNIYKEVIFFIPTKTPVLLKCLFISRMTTCERDVISKWTKWSKCVLAFLLSRVPTLDFDVERCERLVSFFLHISGLFLKQSHLLTRVILLFFLIFVCCWFIASVQCRGHLQGCLCTLLFSLKSCVSWQ